MHGMQPQESTEAGALLLRLGSRSLALDTPHSIEVVIALPYTARLPCRGSRTPLVSSLQVLDEVLRQVAELPPRLPSNVFHLVEVLASLGAHPSSHYDCISLHPCQTGPSAPSCPGKAGKSLHRSMRCCFKYYRETAISVPRIVAPCSSAHLHGEAVHEVPCGDVKV